jgi:hypothetical protein
MRTSAGGGFVDPEADAAEGAPFPSPTPFGRVGWIRGGGGGGW